MILSWNIDPEIVSFGPLHVRWYGLMFVMGFSIGYQQMKKICIYEKLPIEKLDSLLMHLMLGTIIGARLGHCLFYDPDYYLSNPLEILKIWEGGLASHGGVAGVIIATFLFMRKNKEFKLFWLFDRLVIFTALTGCFIRIGNLMNSEILGKPTDGSWGVIFSRIDSTPRHPAMIYESICYFFIFLIGFMLYKKYKEKTPPGLIMGFSIVAVFISRFVIEFFKENQSPFENNMSLNMGQILSIPFIILGLALLIRSLSSKHLKSSP